MCSERIVHLDRMLVLTYRKRTVYVQYSLPDDEHRMFETRRRQEELNENINLKNAFIV